jgi:hypothetical protein
MAPLSANSERGNAFCNVVPQAGLLASCDGLSQADDLTDVVEGPD